MSSMFFLVSQYILPVLFFVVFIFACVKYLFREKETASWLRRVSFKNLAVIVIIARLVYAALLMYLQYVTWKNGGDLGNYFLTASVSKDLPIESFKYIGWIFENKFGYFLFYSWGRFWLSALLSIVSAFLFFGFLRILKKKTERFFDVGETELGLVCALLVGWPLFVVFIPFVFVGVVLVSIFRLIVFKEQYTTLGYPFLVAVVLTFLLGNFLLQLLQLGVLRI